MNELAPRKVILESILSPGDAVAMTAAVESLHLAYPGRFITDVRTAAREIWQHNPRITPLQASEPSVELLRVGYDAIHRSNQEPISFLEGYCRGIGDALGLPRLLHCLVNRPYLYLSEGEKTWIDQIREHFTHGRPVSYWLVNAGTKSDFTCKQWPVEFYQQVIDLLAGRVQFVQVGAAGEGQAGHRHVKLTGVIDLVGQTDHRQLIRLAYHAKGGLGPVTYLQHLMAAWQKPYVCLLGGREPAAWVQYPLQTTLHTLGALKCCEKNACWKSRIVPLGDGDDKDASDKLCDLPMLGMKQPVAKCMAMIRPGEVVATIERSAYKT